MSVLISTQANAIEFQANFFEGLNLDGLKKFQKIVENVAFIYYYL